MQKVERNQLWEVLRGGEWCRARVVNVLSDRVNLFFTERDAVKENAVMVTLGEMKNFEKFRFIADGADPHERFSDRAGRSKVNSGRDGVCLYAT